MTLVMSRDELPLFCDFLGISQGNNPRKHEVNASSMEALRRNSTSIIVEEEGEASTRTLSANGGRFDLSSRQDLPSHLKPRGETYSNRNGAYGPESDRMRGKKCYNFGSEIALREHMNTDEIGSCHSAKVLRLDKDFLQYKYVQVGKESLEAMAAYPPGLSSQGTPVNTTQPLALRQEEHGLSPALRRLDAGVVRMGGAGHGSDVGFNAKTPKMVIPLASTLITPPAPADEGSRTGLRGSCVTSLCNSASNNPPKPLIAPGPSHTNEKAKQLVVNDLNRSSCQQASQSGRQLTIFYGGQAHVFDDVTTDKAESILSLAGSNGRSWSTVYSPDKGKEKAPLKGKGTPLGLTPISQQGPHRGAEDFQRVQGKGSHFSQFSPSAQGNTKGSASNFFTNTEDCHP